MIDLRSYVRENQHVMDFVQNSTPGVIDKYVGTLDYATARFNTILLKLSQDPLALDTNRKEVHNCFQTIQMFYFNTKKLIEQHWLLRPYIKIKLHYIGKFRIPKIKKLLENLTN